jgi:hypothetical protein
MHANNEVGTIQPQFTARATNPADEQGQRMCC